VAGQEHSRECPISFISLQEESMNPAALAPASTLAVCSSLALAHTVDGIAGGRSKAGSPAALSTTTSASISGGESHRKHKAYSELSGMRIAQAGAPSGRGSTTGDPAASSSNPDTSTTTGSAMKPSPSGSVTSTSGGRDDNDDQGRDKMSDSNKAVRANNQPEKR